MRFSQIQVNTTSGAFTPEKSSVKGLFWQMVMTNVLERKSTDEVLYWYDQKYKGPELKPYGIIQFELSN